MRHGNPPERRKPAQKQKIAPFCFFLSDNNCRFLSKYLSGTKPGLLVLNDVSKMQKNNRRVYVGYFNFAGHILHQSEAR
jgi:hypothetical protein